MAEHLMLGKIFIMQTEPLFYSESYIDMYQSDGSYPPDDLVIEASDDPFNDGEIEMDGEKSVHTTREVDLNSVPRCSRRILHC